MRNLMSIAKLSAVALSLMLVLSNLFVSAAGQSTLVAVQGPPVDLRGIYIYTNDVSQITKATANALTASFSIPGVDGVAVVIGWDAIEPTMGQYQWILLDQWMGQAIALAVARVIYEYA